MSSLMYTPVRTRRGRVVHAMSMRPSEDATDGAVACGRTSASGWVVASGKLPNCFACFRALGEEGEAG